MTRPADDPVFRVLAFTFLIVGIGAIAMMCSSCAREQRHKPFVFEERAGGVVAKVLSEATGRKIDAVTPPGLPPLVFRNSNDPCLVVHELTHVEQQERDGYAVFKARYLYEYLSVGYARVSYELEARDRQQECEFSRMVGTASRGWTDPETKRMARSWWQRQAGAGERP